MDRGKTNHCMFTVAESDCAGGKLNGAALAGAIQDDAVQAGEAVGIEMCVGLGAASAQDGASQYAVAQGGRLGAQGSAAEGDGVIRDGNETGIPGQIGGVVEKISIFGDDGSVARQGGDDLRLKGFEQ